jgi:hypothetical protein
VWQKEDKMANIVVMCGVAAALTVGAWWIGRLRADLRNWRNKAEIADRHLANCGDATMLELYLDHLDTWNLFSGRAYSALKAKEEESDENDH